MIHHTRRSYDNGAFIRAGLQHRALAAVFMVVSHMGWASPAAEQLPVDVALAELEEAAIRKAVQRAAPAVVRIWVAGGQERIGKIEAGGAPTTGLIVDAEGWVVTSLFNLAHRPAGVVVELADGRKRGARLVAIDHSKMLVLLKVDTSGLPAPALAQKARLRPGQSTIAVGRSWLTDEPSIAVGILSALDRIEGKALQTDASVSPVNYGGPLVDLSGNVMGVLVPLAPGSRSATAGVEWYDSGVGFAIPLTDIRAILPRWQKGDLHPGDLAGVAFASTGPFGAPPSVAMLSADSVAAKAGLQVGDRIVAVDGSPVRRFADYRRLIGPKYAGDPVVLTVERPDGRHTVRVELSPPAAERS